MERKGIAAFGMFFLFWFTCGTVSVLITAIPATSLGGSPSTAGLVGLIVGIVEAVHWKGGKDTGSCFGTSAAWGLGIGIAATVLGFAFAGL